MFKRAKKVKIFKIHIPPQTATANAKLVATFVTCCNFAATVTTETSKTELDS